MPSSEAFYYPRSLEAPHTDHGERAAHPNTSPRMEQVVTNLAARYNVDLSQKGATLNLDVPEQQRWMIGNIDGQRVGVSRLKVDKDNGLTPELDMVFVVNPAGSWEPIEIVHTPTVWQAYANATHRRSVVDAQGDFDFGAFADHWAQQIEEGARLEDERKAKEPEAGPILARNEIIFLYERDLQAL